MALRLCEVLEHGQSHRAVPGESWPLSLFHTRSAPNRASQPHPALSIHLTDVVSWVFPRKSMESWIRNEIQRQYEMKGT